jgi:uncharacterized iron-regulated membrane protein
MTDNLSHSLHEAESSKRRIILGVLGGILVISGVIMAWSFARQEYYDFYAIPKDKGDNLFPRRWQDFVVLGGIWTILVAWLWAGYWLLRRTFRPPAGG